MGRMGNTQPDVAVPLGAGLEPAGAVLPASAHAPSIVSVMIPATPVTGLRFAAVWNRDTDCAVCGPNAPSACVGIPTALSHRCRALTSLPLSPRRSVRRKDGAGGCATVKWLVTQDSSVVAVISPTSPLTGPRCAAVWN